MMMEDKTIISAISLNSYNSICNDVIDYMLSFQSSDPLIHLNYALKREHIHRVVNYSELLAKSIECEDDVLLLSKLAALLHDIGRFDQFQKYQTFNDFISEDHAEIAVQLINAHKWLKDLSEENQTNLIKAVSFHNKIAIPKNERPEVTLLSQILRDADKLDILDLAVKEYSNQNKNRNNSFTLDLENSSTISKLIAKSFIAEKLPNKSDMKTITDFKLIQMAFVFDLNLRESFSIVNKKGYLKQLFETMPKSDQIFELYRKAKIHVENRLI